MMMLGDLCLVGEPPAKLAKALAVIADGLHRAVDDEPGMKPGVSRESCVLCSAIVREFLFRIGFRDVEVLPVFFALRARRGDEELHSLGIGHPDSQQRKDRANRWDGHLVVVAPSAGYLIDTTLFQARRPIWPALPGMMAVPIVGDDFEHPPREERPFGGMTVAAGAGLTLPDSDIEVSALWFHQPNNRGFVNGKDYQRKARRSRIADTLVQRFRLDQWREGKG